MEIKYRKAVSDDCELILKFIRELAEFEKLAHEVSATSDLLRENLFGPNPRAEVVFATRDNLEIGFALFFNNFSTFLGKPGIYLEDLYVKQDQRGKGVGKGLLQYLALLALERGCGRLEWWVLKWNPARSFYKSIGAESMDEWVVYRLTGDRLKSMAEGKSMANG